MYITSLAKSTLCTSSPFACRIFSRINKNVFALSIISRDCYGTQLNFFPPEDKDPLMIGYRTSSPKQIMIQNHLSNENNNIYTITMIITNTYKGLMQERHNNSGALAMELRLSCTNSMIYTTLAVSFLSPQINPQTTANT